MFLGLLLLAALAGAGISFAYNWIGGVVACIVTGYMVVILGVATNG